ncbi:MAG: ABC transporter ATP-binding protein [Planctomycetota bacterium]|nr:ABC transporter ATP-binding protein [Planctomycetota bacterium]
MTLSARALAVAWPTVGEVLHGVSLELAAGELCVLVGPNGAGKSTLLRALAGLATPSGGQVLLDGAPLAGFGLAERARRIGFLPQEVNPAFNFRAEEAVALGARVALRARWHETGLGAQGRAAVDRALGAVDALPFATRRLDELSGGERRRVLIAGVLAQEPRWLLLDEPAAMLDLHHQTALFRLLRALAADGLGVLCSAHDLNLASRFATRMALIDHGVITIDGPPEQVLRSPELARAFDSQFRLVEDPPGAPAVLPRA